MAWRARTRLCCTRTSGRLRSSHRSSLTPTKCATKFVHAYEVRSATNKRCGPDVRERAPISWPVVVAAGQRHGMLHQLPAVLLEEILSNLTAVQSFSLLRSSTALHTSVRAAANAGQLLKRRRALDGSDDSLRRFLVHSKQAGDKISLFVRDRTNTPYTAVVAVRLLDGWRLDYLDGRPSETCFDADESEDVASMYPMYYKLRI